MYAASLGGKQTSCLIALCILSLHHPSTNSAGAKSVYELSSQKYAWQVSNPAELDSGPHSSGPGPGPQPVAPVISPACSPTPSNRDPLVEASCHAAATQPHAPAAGPPESQAALSASPSAASPTSEVITGVEEGRTTEHSADPDTPAGWEHGGPGPQHLQSMQSLDTQLVEGSPVLEASVLPQALELEVAAASPQEPDLGSSQKAVPGDTTHRSGWDLANGGGTSSKPEKPGGTSQDRITWSQTFSNSQGSLKAQSPPWNFQPAAKRLSSTASWLKLMAHVLGKINTAEDQLAPGAAVPELVMPDPRVADHPTLPRSKDNEGKVVMLIHGGIQGGWVWCYPRPELGASRGVRGILEDQGYRVFTPTLPFHEPYSTWNDTYMAVRASTYVQAIIETFVQHDLHNVTLVGHSLAGVWLQLTLQQIPERINRLIFCNAAVLLSGESFATNAMGQPGQVGFTGVAAFPFFPYPINGSFTAAGVQIADPRARADLFVWEDLLMSEFQGNKTIIYDTYAKLVPEPRAPMLEFFNLVAFYKIPKPKYFVWHTRDFGLPVPTAWLGFAERLRLSPTGTSPVKVFTVDADHEAMISSPDKFSLALLEAIRAA